MSEQLHESQPEHFVDNAAERHEVMKAGPETNSEHQEAAPKDVEAIRSTVKHEAISGKDSMKSELTPDKPKVSPTALLTNKQLKNQAYNKTLSKARKQLSGTDKLASSIIHQPLIEKTSETLANTIARPGAIVCGGIAALTGSLFILITAKKYGFSYNYLVIFALFMIGWTIGTLTSLLSSLTRGKNH